MRDRRHVTAATRSCLLLLLGLALLGVPRASAGTEASDGDLRVEVLCAYNLVVDSNGKQAPSAAYIGAKYHNDGTTTLTDVFAYVGDHTLGTPGLYPQSADLVGSLVGPLPGGKFALTHEGGAAGTADACRYLGDIAPGETVTVYWLVSYEQRDINGVLLWGTSVKPFDDLVVNYDVWGTAKEDGVTDREANVNRTFTFRNEISAAANKIYPNGSNKVPDEYKDALEEYIPSWGTWPNDGSPGTKIIARGIWYDLGNVGAGFDNDGDLVPDRNAWMQPVGDAAAFDPSAYRLVKTIAYVIVKLKGGGVQILEGDDQLYFEHIPENTGAVGWVGYEYFVRKDGGDFTISPYQEVASGSDNEKFNADFGAGPEPADILDLLVTLIKDATATVASGGTIAYTVNFTNDSNDQAIGHPELNMPVIIQDSIPTGTVYLAGTAAAGNTLPTGVTSYTILYSTDNGASWVTTEPAAASVTDIEWWLSDAIPALATGTVTFSVTASGTPTVIPNTAGLAFGPGDPTLEDDALTIVTGTNSITGTVFADTDAANYGDGIMNGTDAAINDITVSLYYDVNNDNLLDDGDILMSTLVTAGGTAYSFTSLADGEYLVVVDTADADLPSGSALTSKEVLAVTLSASNATGQDFGFAPALSLDKQLVGSSPVTEGDTVQYTIDVGNRLPGDGTGLGTATNDISSSSYTTSGDAWTDPWDGTSGGHLPSSNPGTTILSGFELAGTGSILGNDLILNVTLSGAGPPANDLFTVVVADGADLDTAVTVSTTHSNSFSK
jgi:uncharacterized repeat protein (TIGR01451 family)